MRTVGRALALLAFTATAAGATPILVATGEQVLSTDPSQLGRISRDGIPSDWSAAKAFPGVINTGTTYHYETYSVNVGLGEYVQISMDFWGGTNSFIAAYDTSYNPASIGTNYLGDIGSSGNLFGNPGFFQVHIGVGHTLVLVVTNITGVSSDLFDLLVEGFIDTEYTDIPDSPAPVPEPATMLLGGTGLAFLAARRRAGRKTAA